MTQQIVIDIPASLATALPSAETLAYAGAWLIVGFAALILFGLVSIVLNWLQTPSKPVAKKLERDPLTWLPRKYGASNHN
jgi:hypothetical protein